MKATLDLKEIRFLRRVLESFHTWFVYEGKVSQSVWNKLTEALTIPSSADSTEICLDFTEDEKKLMKEMVVMLTTYFTYEGKEMAALWTKLSACMNGE